METLLPIVLLVYPEVELLGHRVGLFSTFWGSSTLVPRAAGHLTFPPEVTRISGPPNPPQHLLCPVVPIIAILVSEKRLSWWF